MKTLLSTLCMLLLYSMTGTAQVTTTINATGTPGSYNTGSVNSGGTKNDGHLTNIRTSANRGWAVFDLSTIPSGATVTKVQIEFTTYSSTNSTATNYIRGLLADPKTMSGSTLYSQLGSATAFVSTNWPANNTHLFNFNNAGVNFINTNAGSKVVIAFVRGSTNQYNIYGYPGTNAQQPKLKITYDLPCTGQPNAGTIDAPTDVCPNKNFTLKLTGNTLASNMNFQWQSKPATSGSFANIGTNSPSLTTSISVPTEFRCIVKCNTSGLSDITPIVSIAVNNFYTCYCKDNIGGNSTASIDSVHILKTTLDNGSKGTAPGSYTQYPPNGNQTANLQAGGVYYLYVGYGADAIGSVWIDANQNGNYESSEWTQINTSGVEGMALVRIPPNAMMGLTGMRIRSAAAGATNGAGNACSNISSGEVEDYVVNIVPPPTNDVKVVTVLTPAEGKVLCPFTDIDYSIVIYNNGTNTQTTFPIAAQMGGPATSTVTYNYSRLFQPFTFDTVKVNSYNLFFVGKYNLVAYTQLNGDSDASNDTTDATTFDITFAPSAPIVFNDSVCYGEDATIFVKDDQLTHKWYNDPNKIGGPVYFGDTMKFAGLQQDNVFLVTSQLSTFRDGALTTINKGGNGCSGGTMFNLTPNEDMSIDSFAARFNGTGSQSVSVHYRIGTFAGFEDQSGAWTLVGSGNANVTSTSALTDFTINNQFLVKKGVTYGIYIQYDASYTNGSNTYSNADLTIETGTGLCNPFSGLNKGREFNGTVYYSVGSDGCESQMSVIGAYAGPPPVVNLGGDVNVCADAKLVLDAGNPGAKYIWNTGDRKQKLEITGRNGKFWVEVDKFCKRSDTVTVTLDPLPLISGGISYVNTGGNSYNFTASGLQHTSSILWIFGDGTTNTAQQVTHVYKPSEPKNVTLIAYNQCGTDTSFLTVPLDVNNVQGEGAALNIYPNPASNSLTISVTGGEQLSDVMIVNTLGAVVYRNTATANSDKLVVDVSNLAAGNYIVRVSNGDAILSKPLIISR